MSIYNDNRLEALALKRGAPLGPRMLPRVTCDEEGLLTTYTDKLCRVCDVQLTSRNRFGASLLCNEHGRAEERARVRSGANRPAGAVRATRAATSKEPVGDQCPHRKAVHRALSGFLFHPFDECAYRHTIDVMHEYELRARLLNVLPSPDAVASPIETIES